MATFFQLILGCLVILLLFSPPVYSQQGALKFEHISLEQGLSQNTITSIIQDSDGFIWFGTLDGLNRYDGYDFKVYKHIPADSNSLSASTIWSVYEDRLGVIWIGTLAAGLNKFDPKTEKFTHYKYAPNNPNGLSDNRVRAIFEDKNGNLWIGTRDKGLNRFDREEDKFVHYKHNINDSKSISDNHIRTIVEDGSGFLWIGTYAGGLNKFNPTTGTFTHFKHNPKDLTSIGHNHIESLYFDRSGVLWIGTYGSGLNKLAASSTSPTVNSVDGQPEKFIKYKHNPQNPKSISNDFIEVIYEDHTGDLWIGSNAGGLNKFDRQSENFYHYRYKQNDPTSISYDNVEAIYEDWSGNLWIGTWGGGVDKLNLKAEKFVHYRNNPNDPNSLGHNYVRSIREDPFGAIWVGTSGGGIVRINRQEEVFSHFTHDPDIPNSLSSNDVRAICIDRSNNLWVGTYGGGLNRLLLDYSTSVGLNSSKRSGLERKLEFQHYKSDPKNPDSLSDNFIWSIYEDKAGTLWIGTNKGLHRLDVQRKVFENYLNAPDDPNSLSHNIVRSIYEDRSGVLWIGTYGGLNKFNRVSKSFTRYKHDPSNPNSLSNNGIMAIFEDEAGVLWLGTLGGGLNKFDRRKEQFTHYLESDGLPNAFVHAIQGDNNGNLWLSTNKGLSKFDPRTEKFRNYDVRDGLQSNEFNAGASFKGRSGELFFGGINGLNIFHPENIEDNPYVPPIVLTAFKVFNRDARFDRALSKIQEIQLSYEDRFFSFEFAALDFTNSAKNQYAFMMEGFDSNWIYSGTRRYASYTNLDPGDYVFRVKGSNNDGIWNEEGISVNIKIIPPFWHTWWFRILSLLTTVGIFLFIIQRRFSNLRKAKIVQEKFSKRLIEMQEKERKRIASELHDSLGQNLLIMKNSIEQYVNAHSNENEALDDLNELSTIATQSINEVREISYDLHPHLLDRLGLTKAIESMMKKLSQSTHIKFSFEIDGINELLSKKKDIHIYRIIQEGVNNLVKHAHASEAKIHVKKKNNFLNIQIKDNGKGFDFRSYMSIHSQNQGFGITGISERVKILNGEFSVDSSFKSGTTLDIKIPI